MKKTTIDFYKKQLHKYGITSILIALKVFEGIEEFEECEKIISMIKSHNEIANDCLPTQFEDVDIRSFNAKQFSIIANNSRKLVDNVLNDYNYWIN